MAQQPAVVIIARHGFRLDAADPSWHLSTPAPYDPPLTYGGWKQCRALGQRIATLLEAREREAETPEPAGVRSHKHSNSDTHAGSTEDGGSDERPRKRRRIKHKVVIHSSPFLRCLQTSVAIAAGMAQYKPVVEGRPRTASRSHSSSPRVKTMEGRNSPNLPPIAEPDLVHTLAKKSLQQPKHYRKSALRVDAFLGEWLNPEYYESILPPPPSSMMVATAKAELMQNETVEIFTPTTSQSSSSGNLWTGTNPSRESTLDDWSPVEQAVPTSPVSPRRRASQSSVGSIDRPKSPFRPGSALQPLTSTLPKPEISVYHPPHPQYAVSSSDPIPRGYVSHARTACTNVDYQWDSSRQPQSWGDGGEFGEEWSAMHKRFRRGLNHLIGWYSRHDINERSDVEQADHRPATKPINSEDDEQEDVVVIMITHGAGCNALIGALTGQPVLLDVGMASLTMAVRKENAPSLTTYASSSAPSPRASPTPENMALNGSTRRASFDLGLASIYDLKLVASTEHLRPVGANASPSMRPIDANGRQAFIDTHRLQRGLEQPRSNTSSALGSILRRPSAITGPPIPLLAGSQDRRSSLPPGLWAPTAAPLKPPQAPSHLRTSELQRPGLFSSYSDVPATSKEEDDGVALLDFSNSPAHSRPTSSHGQGAQKEDAPVKSSEQSSAGDGDDWVPEMLNQKRPSHSDGNWGPEMLDSNLPTSLSRGLSQKGLWGAKPSGSMVERKGREAPKRRWTAYED